MEETQFPKTVALIGAGYWGKNLARNFYNLGALHTLGDLNEATLDRYEEQYPDVRVTSNIKAILEDPAIKQVAIATPGHSHYELARDALLAGKDLYVEKPLCLDCAQGEDLVRIAEEEGRILMVGHILQYHPCVRKLQEMLSSGQLGKLQYIVSNRLNLGKIQAQENALWSFAPHDVSVILSLCGHKLPEQVRCTGADYLLHNVADVTMTTMRFSGGVRAHIYVSWLNPFKEQKLVVVGSEGMLVFDDTKSWDDKLVLYRNCVTWSEGNIPRENKIEGEPIEVEQAEPLREECMHFLNASIKRTPARTSGREGVRVLKVLQAAQASLNEDGEAKDPSHTHDIALGARDYDLHSSSYVDSGAQVGAGTKIWHYSHIMSGAKIGANCNIGQNVVVSPGVKLGKNVKVQNNVSIYSGVECGDDVFLGPSMVFTNIPNPRSHVVRKGEFRKTSVGTGTTIGANATVLCGITLGEHCFVGAGAVVTKDVPPYALVVGNPGKQVGWMSRHGCRLDLPVMTGEGNERRAICPESGEEYVLRGTRLSPARKKGAREQLATV